MPSFFMPTAAETELREPGTGGKPPVARRPTGGAGGGGDDDWKNPQRHPRELLYRVRVFLFLALAADMMLFAGLVAIFCTRQAGMRVDAVRPMGGVHPSLLLSILFLNTVVLILSNLSMERARQHIFREIDVLEEWLGLGRPALRRALPWLAATLGLGVLFLLGQAVAWRQLTAPGSTQAWTAAGHFFCMLAGLHAAQLALGMLALVLCLSALGWLKRVEFRQIAVDATAWFWHAMGLVWLLLLAALIFVGR